MLRREDGHVLRRTLDFKVKGQWKKGMQKRAWSRQDEEECMKVGLNWVDVLWQ